MEKEPKWTFSELLAGKHTEWIECKHDEKLRKVCSTVATWKERANNKNEYPICYGCIGCVGACPLVGGVE